MARPKDKEDKKYPVTLTKAASAQLKKALARERAPDGGVRILLIEAGNGYRYDMQIEKKSSEGDHVSTQGGVKVFVDRFAAQHLNGTQLDFIDAPNGTGFLFHRPEST
ncbi:MAG TPA: iron-sulfur cluster assembly accessory protein [Myxococcales bacterium]|nr:iron-sulfur cluster assembly accessory protein [Deltaproteobacteria bacterium]MBU53395.1 iron-sulfur cluster assembly accessory protein [Deltaproteobacteria bacterium]HAA55495.1 iron-sulfur cluster assembly accessory protein [Myxococcales bacterium]|tara:strand:- start:10665 stop:10988 length:324 start_codon:yes stop_codon:yes gene_type:complete